MRTSSQAPGDLPARPDGLTACTTLPPAGALVQIEGWIEDSAPHRLLASNISPVEGPLPLEADLSGASAVMQISSVSVRLEICGMAPVLQLPVCISER